MGNLFVGKNWNMSRTWRKEYRRKVGDIYDGRNKKTVSFVTSKVFCSVLFCIQHESDKNIQKKRSKTVVVIEVCFSYVLGRCIVWPTSSAIQLSRKAFICGTHMASISPLLSPFAFLYASEYALHR